MLQRPYPVRVSTPQPFQLAASWRLVHCIGEYAAAFTAVLDARFGTDYIDDGQVLALHALRLRGSSLVSELADATALDGEAVLRFMRELRTRGLVTSERAAGDRRQRAYSFTDAGAAAAGRTESDLARFFAQCAALADEIADLTASEASGSGSRDMPGVGLLDPWARAADISRTGQQLSRAIVDRLGEDRERKVQGRRILAVLVICSRADVRPSTLADELGLSAAGATYLLDVLERDGLVTRERKAEGDRRATCVLATAEGLAAATAVHDALQDIKPDLHTLFVQIGSAAPAKSAARMG